jgi:hypothetical protein
VDGPIGRSAGDIPNAFVEFKRADSFTEEVLDESSEPIASLSV